jgi:thiosulfate/3-mercaptopyruvate sulfurtransferase
MSTPCLLKANELKALLSQSDPTRPLMVLDTRFDLGQTEAGLQAFEQGHIPGARYVHLERELSGAKRIAPDTFRGRHPLPERASFAATVGGWGLTPAHRVVVTDAADAMFAARLWWMLRWLGHESVSVLDGGMLAWSQAAGPVEAGPNPPTHRNHPPYPPSPALEAVIEAEELQASLAQVRLIDARAPERYRGETEPLDTAAGHIPGAVNRFFKLNLASDGCFKPHDQLRAEFTALLEGEPPEGAKVVQQCGSGVTACHNLLAMRHAGLEAGRLYPGSWSEWCSNPLRPRATGECPGP